MATEPQALSEAVLEQMRHHLEEEHGRKFELTRDVSREGNTNPEAILTHRPATLASAEGFWCALCPGTVFLTAAEPDLSGERIAYLARRDPELARLLAEVGEEEGAELVRAHRAERSAPAVLQRQRRKERLRTAKPQPAAEARRRRANAYMLAKYEEIGDAEEARWALAQLRPHDPKAYRKIMGNDHDYKIETLKKYWNEIPLKERQAAKQRFLERQRSG